MKDEKKLNKNYTDSDNCCCNSKEDEQAKKRKCSSKHGDELHDKQYDDQKKCEFGRESDINPFVITNTISRQTIR